LFDHAGTFMTDINLGIYTAQLDPARSISATKPKSFRSGITPTKKCASRTFYAVCSPLPLRRRKLGRIPRPKPINPFQVKIGKAPLTVKRLFERFECLYF